MAKLQEFQQQLDMAEKEMESDARSKEISIVDTYNKQISRIEEQWVWIYILLTVFVRKQEVTASLV